MTFDGVGVLHLASALVALLAGLVVLVSAKGTPRHRRAGWLYVVAMGMVNVTALLIYDLFGGFGPFHVAALLSGLAVLGGLLPAIRRNPTRRWIPIHAYWMAGSYVGLVAAAVSESATRWLALPFGWTVAVATTVVLVVGLAWMQARLPTTLRNLRSNR